VAYENKQIRDDTIEGKGKTTKQEKNFVWGSFKEAEVSNQGTIGKKKKVKVGEKDIQKQKICMPVREGKKYQDKTQ